MVSCWTIWASSNEPQGPWRPNAPDARPRSSVAARAPRTATCRSSPVGPPAGGARLGRSVPGPARTFAAADAGGAACPVGGRDRGGRRAAARRRSGRGPGSVRAERADAARAGSDPVGPRPHQGHRALEDARGPPGRPGGLRTPVRPQGSVRLPHAGRDGPRRRRPGPGDRADADHGDRIHRGQLGTGGWWDRSAHPGAAPGRCAGRDLQELPGLTVRWWPASGRTCWSRWICRRCREVGAGQSCRTRGRSRPRPLEGWPATRISRG
jgi:hypothetical protein